MEIDLTAFHFLRPQWLWLLVPAVLLPVFWFRRNSVRARWRNIIDPLLLEHLIVGDTARRAHSTGPYAGTADRHRSNCGCRSNVAAGTPAL